MGPLLNETVDLVVQDMGKAELPMPSLLQPFQKDWPLGSPGSLQERSTLNGR